MRSLIFYDFVRKQVAMPVPRALNFLVISLSLILKRPLHKRISVFIKFKVPWYILQIANLCTLKYECTFTVTIP